jgi:hypothetical protein
MGLVFLLLAGAGLSLPGCSRQGEGERCSRTANVDADCDDGLVCVPDKSTTDFGRCCPPEGAQISDSRCNFSTTTSTGGTSSGGGTSTGGSTSGGTSSGGASSGGVNAGGDSSTGGTSNSGEGGSGATSGASDVAGADGG